MATHTHTLTNDQFLTLTAILAGRAKELSAHPNQLLLPTKTLYQEIFPSALCRPEHITLGGLQGRPIPYPASCQRPFDPSLRSATYHLPNGGTSTTFSISLLFKRDADAWQLTVRSDTSLPDPVASFLKAITPPTPATPVSQR